MQSDSSHPNYQGNIVSAGFVSNLTEVLFKAELWLHGHMHDSFDYQIGTCRVVANPAGYIRNRRTLDRIEDAVLENSAFNSWCLIEVPSDL